MRNCPLSLLLLLPSLTSARVAVLPSFATARDGAMLAITGMVN